MDKLFEPNFGPDLSAKILETLIGEGNRALVGFGSTFERFSDITTSGLPIDPLTFEVFNVENYLPEIQFAYELAASVDFAAKGFKASDLYDALFPTSIPTVKSFGAFIKKKVLAMISSALDGLFDAKVDIPTLGLTVDNVTLGAEGLNIGMYTDGNNQLFPPVVNVDKLEVRSPLHTFMITLAQAYLGSHHGLTKYRGSC